MSNLKSTLSGSPEIGTANPNGFKISTQISGRPEYPAVPPGGKGSVTYKPKFG